MIFIKNDELIQNIKKDEWVVLKKFHLIKGEHVDFKYFDLKKDKSNKSIVLTDSLLDLKKNIQFENLHKEVDGRWNLLERAWQLKIPERLLLVENDIKLDFSLVEILVETIEMFFVEILFDILDFEVFSCGVNICKLLIVLLQELLSL